MPSTAELDLLHADNLAAHGRTVTVFANPAGTKGTLTGIDGSTFNDTDSVTAICHEARPSFRSAPGGGGGARQLERTFGFRLSDLATVCALTSGLPREGRFAISDPDDGVTEVWWADTVNINGDRSWVDITCVRASGRRPAEEV